MVDPTFVKLVTTNTSTSTNLSKDIDGSCKGEGKETTLTKTQSKLLALPETVVRCART